MRRVLVEYMGGPADGRREPIGMASDAPPARWLAVPAPELYESWLDTQPVAPEQMHRYELTELVARPTGVSLLRYQHRGSFG